jgi:NAD(P)-dependent dehydrogenase (short-subunit alcohol dehydrogenase family)
MLSDRKIALVTGGNRGIGLALCEQLEQRGFLVLLTARTLENAQDAVKRLSLSPNIRPYSLNITDPKSLEAFTIQLTKDGVHQIDLLINNAGINIDYPSVSPGAKELPSVFATTADTLKKTFETNVVGSYLVTQALLNLLKASPQAMIINVSSGMGRLSSDINAGWPAYSISKTALNALTKVMAAELRESGITVNSVCPGWVKTNMGGPQADLSPEESADNVLWLCENVGSRTGLFFKDKQEISW